MAGQIRTEQMAIWHLPPPLGKSRREVTPDEGTSVTSKACRNVTVLHGKAVGHHAAHGKPGQEDFLGVDVDQALGDAR